jgi:hypothetical protein
MSCENTNARLQIKYTTIAGQEPTIPSTNDHNDGTWNPTDIYLGEFFLNAVDDKLWVRTIDGLLPMGGTGGTGSFIGDFVSKANGGTYSGPVFAPTFSAISMIANTISASAFDGIIFGSSASTYYGDGSNLTGITTNWNGGTVSDPTQFDNTVDFNQDISINNVYYGTLGYIDIHSDVIVNGGLSASYFVGDGSLLTNLPMGPTANYYTTNSYLDGNTIRFDRTDLADAYSVDLTPILFTQSIASFDWNSSLNEATIFINDGSFFTINLNVFSNISTGIINATDVYATNFYGTFNGIFPDANLEQVLINGNVSGSQSIIMNKGYGIYSAENESTGMTLVDAGDIRITATDGILPFPTDEAFIVIQGNGNIGLEGTGALDINFNNVAVAGDSTFAGIEYVDDYSANYTNRSLVDKEYVDTHGGSGGATGLGGVLAIGNQTDGTDINLNGGDKIISDDTQKIIEFQEPRILIQNEYSTTEYTYTGLLEVKNDVAISQLAHIRNDLTSGDTITTAVQIDETTATITSNNLTTTNEAFVRADSGSGTVPQAEVRLWTSDFFGNVSYMIFNPGNIEVSGSNSDGFGGIEYGSDYSADYSARSLVDKEYVDGVVSAGATGLGGVLSIDNETGNNWIDASINYGLRSGGGDVERRYTFDGDALVMFATDSTDEVEVSLSNTGFFQVRNTNQIFFDQYNAPSGTDFTVRGSNAGGFKGIEYDADYSTDFTNRSLVDKEYVDSVAGSSFVYITENTTTGTLTMSAPTSITSTVSDGISDTVETITTPSQVETTSTNGTKTSTETITPVSITSMITDGSFTQSIYIDSQTNKNVIEIIKGTDITSIKTQDTGSNGEINMLVTDGINTSNTQQKIDFITSFVYDSNTDIADTISLDPQGLGDGTGIISYDNTNSIYSKTTYIPTQIINSVSDDGYQMKSSKSIITRPQGNIHQTIFSNNPSVQIVEDKRGYWTQTSDATTTVIAFTDVDPVIIGSYTASVVQVKAKVRGILDDKTLGYAAEITSWVRLNVGSITQIGSVDYVIKSEFTTAASSFVISGPNMYIDVTGETGKTIDWTCSLEIVYDVNAL